ncbi:hypothetical protein S83_019799, partial [Arachis hypogaea]
KNAKKNAAKLVQLNEQNHEAISIPTPPLKFAELLATKGIKSFESRNEIVRAVIEKLKEEGCNKISICGKPLYRLDLTFADKDPMLERAQKLLNRINKSPGVLIVLDDVWTGLDLDSNGNGSTCKVIFTSRNEGECSKMGSQKTFTVNALSKEDSWALFKELVGGDVVIKSEIHHIAEDIAKQCGGLPIAIMTVGKALRGKRDKYVWESALKDLRKSSASFSKVEKCIELRYTLLDKRNAKDLLFRCCSFPEDTDIPIEALLREGWGLGTLFQDKYFISSSHRFHRCSSHDFLSDANRPEATISCKCSIIKEQNKLKLYKARAGIQEVHFLPFNPTDKRTALTYINQDSKIYRVSKGAPEKILHLAHNKSDIEHRVHAVIDKFAERGLRSLAVAYQVIDEFVTLSFTIFAIFAIVPDGRKESAGGPWKLIGLMPLFDPPRHDSAETIRRALNLGVNVKMITGDQLAIGKEAGRCLGIGTNMYPSSALFEQDKDEFIAALPIDELIEKADGFASVFPKHKYEIVKRLQNKKPGKPADTSQFQSQLDALGLRIVDIAANVGLRVLVVDDEPTWLRILEKMLKKCSYEGCVLFHSAPLDAGTIFTVLATLRIMLEPVRMISETLSILIQVVVSFDRLNTFLLNTFLLAEELGSNKIVRSVKQSSVGDNNAVEIKF